MLMTYHSFGPIMDILYIFPIRGTHSLYIYSHKAPTIYTVTIFFVLALDSFGADGKTASIVFAYASETWDITPLPVAGCAYSQQIILMIEK